MWDNDNILILRGTMLWHYISDAFKSRTCIISMDCSYTRGVYGLLMTHEGRGEGELMGMEYS